MRKFLSILLLAAFSAFGQFSTTTPTDPLGSKSLVVDSGSWTDLTNKVARTIADTNYIAVVPPGTYFGTNTFSWAGCRVFGMPGSFVVEGLSNAHSAARLFDDLGVAKNTVWVGYTSFYISNSAQLTFLSNAASVIFFECTDAINNTTFGAPPIFLHQGGDGDYTIRGTAYNRAYDTVDVFGGRSTWRGRRLQGSFNQAIEIAANSGFTKFDFDIIEPNTNNPCGGALVTLDTDSLVRAGKIFCWSNSYVETISVGTGEPPILEADILAPPENSGRVLWTQGVGGPPLIVRNSRVKGGTTGIPILADDPIIFENSDVEAGSGASQTINTSATADVYLRGASHLNKGVAAGVTVHGLISLTNGLSKGWAVGVNLTADNQTLNCTNISYIKLSSDNVTAANRTFVLSQGIQGQELDIEWVGTNAGEIADDSAVTGGGNARLNATWTPTQYDVLSLRFNGTDWIERAPRSAN